MLFSLWCLVQDIEFDYIVACSLYFCLHVTIRGYLDLLNLINNVGKMKHDIITISQAVMTIDIEAAKLVENMLKLPLIYCNSIPLYFSTKAKKHLNSFRGCNLGK